MLFVLVHTISVHIFGDPSLLSSSFEFRDTFDLLFAVRKCFFFLLLLLISFSICPVV